MQPTKTKASGLSIITCHVPNKTLNVSIFRLQGVAAAHLDHPSASRKTVIFFKQQHAPNIQIKGAYDACNGSTEQQSGKIKRQSHVFVCFFFFSPFLLVVIIPSSVMMKRCGLSQVYHSGHQPGMLTGCPGAFGFALIQHNVQPDLISSATPRPRPTQEAQHLWCNRVLEVEGNGKKFYPFNRLASSGLRGFQTAFNN